MLSCEGVHYRYEHARKDALFDVSLRIEAGERIALVGKNGSGKTTFARLLNGLYEPTKGRLCFTRQDGSNPDALHYEVGMVFQNPENQMVTSIVEDDLAFGLENRALSSNEITTRIQNCANQLGIVDLLQRDISQLSGGQKQRVALAGVLVMLPSVLVLDEATSMLDPVGRLVVNEQLDKLYHAGTTILSITHDVEELNQCTRVIGFSQGSVVFDGTPASLFEQDEVVRQLGLTLPFRNELKQALNRNGIHLEKDSYDTEDELEEAIWMYSLNK